MKTSSDPFISGAMEKANAQVKRMSNMINGFLNISRLESGKIMIEKTTFDLQQLVREVIDESAFGSGSHVIEFVDQDPKIIVADRVKINSVISNLLSNAVKHSPANQLIKVQLTSADNNLVVSVTDQGVGIKLADLERVFERYYRITDHVTWYISGFGIGLFLSAEIINRHDGKIWVNGESGKGSAFFFSLPIC